MAIPSICESPGVCVCVHSLRHAQQWHDEELSSWDNLHESATASTLDLGDNEVSSAVAIGFPFEFMKDNFTNV